MSCVSKVNSAKFYIECLTMGKETTKTVSSWKCSVKAKKTTISLKTIPLILEVFTLNNTCSVRIIAFLVGSQWLFICLIYAEFTNGSFQTCTSINQRLSTY